MEGDLKPLVVLCLQCPHRDRFLVIMISQRIDTSSAVSSQSVTQSLREKGGGEHIYPDTPHGVNGGRHKSGLDDLHFPSPSLRLIA